MENQKSAADRIRPILQAMERSIDSARSRRTNVPGTNAAPSTTPPTRPQTQPMNNGPRPLQPMPGVRPSSPQPAAAPAPDPNVKQPLKARPKRDTNFGGASGNGAAASDSNPRPSANYRTFIW